VRSKDGLFTKDGLLTNDGLPINDGLPVKDGLLTMDELLGMCLRAQDVSAFAPLFEDGGLSTAANVAAEGDGVAGLLIASADRAAALGLVPQARFVSFATAGASPAIWPVASIEATGRALGLAGLALDDIDHFEINESSAAAVLAWMAALGADPARVNPTGGSLAWTAPQGAVGAGLFVAAVAGLAERNEQRALVSVAGEGGVATACVLERTP
jgi:acetyl-CoA acetyltransferase